MACAVVDLSGDGKSVCFVLALRLGIHPVPWHCERNSQNASDRRKHQPPKAVI